MEWLVSEGEAPTCGDQPELNAEKLAGAVRAVLRETPSIFGCLVHVASPHSPETHNHFCQQFAALGYDRERIDRALWREHCAIFADWLSLSLEQNWLTWKRVPRSGASLWLMQHAIGLSHRCVIVSSPRSLWHPRWSCSRVIWNYFCRSWLTQRM